MTNYIKEYWKFSNNSATTLSNYLLKLFFCKSGLFWTPEKSRFFFRNTQNDVLSLCSDLGLYEISFPSFLY